MALKTKKEVCDEILVEVYGGQYTNDVTISLNFVVRELNNIIAENAVKSAFGTYNLDGCVCADDIFTLTYSNLTLLTDTNTGNKYFPLPSLPIGIPSKRAITVFPPANRGGVMNDLFKGIMRSDVTKVRRLPNIRKVFHYTENGNENFIDNNQIMAGFSSLNASIVTSGANDLSAFLNMPDDMINATKMTIVPRLRAMIGIQDTTPIPPMDAPAPRQGV